ncbi:MAG: T9SS type A sorting domain-containing protein [Saprospiraceae bacterium]
MNRIILSFFILFFYLSAWSQAGGERRAAEEEMQTTVPDSLALEIHSEFGWNLCAGGTLELYTDYVCEKYEWFHNDSLLTNDESSLITTEGGQYQLRISEDDSLIYSTIVEVQVHQPTVPTITYDENVLSTSLAEYYQWYKDDISIPNASAQMLYLLDSGDYYVETTDENGCIAKSEIFSFTVANIHEVKLQSIDAYPSPTRDRLFITPINIENQDFTLSLFSQTGQLLQQTDGRLRDNRQLELDLHDLPQGTYFLQFLGEQVQLIEQVVKL